jgi:adenosylcobinamide-GDP ribazoletransferase
MSGAALALGFLTRLPVPGAGSLAPGALARAAVWFPLVGVLVGAALGGTRLLADLALSPLAATVLAVAVAIALTGGLHEDGLGDTADGLGAHASRERRLEIMRDSRLGTFGVLAVVLAVLLAVALLASLDGEACLRAAIAAHALARWSMLAVAAFSPPARAAGDGPSAGALLRVGPLRLAVATAIAVGAAFAAAGPGPGLVALGAAALAGAALAGWATRAVGGVTGDVLGAVGKAAELGCLVALAALWS